MEDSLSSSISSDSSSEFEDVKNLISLTKNCDFFKKLIEDQQSDEIHKMCCEAMQIRSYRIGESIIRYGDIGNDFYIILKGTVGVYVPSMRRSSVTIQSEEEARKSLLRTRRVSIFRYTAAEINNFTNNNIIYLAPIPDASNFDLVLKMNAGETFGELALLNNKPRAATVVALSNSILASLSKLDFEKLLSKFTEKRLNEKLRFFQIHPMFVKCGKLSLMKMTFYFTLKKIQRGQFLFKAGDVVDGLYFVKKGEFLV